MTYDMITDLYVLAGVFAALFGPLVLGMILDYTEGRKT